VGQAPSSHPWTKFAAIIICGLLEFGETLGRAGPVNMNYERR
jgi:hypothetical protein